MLGAAVDAVLSRPERFTLDAALLPACPLVVQLLGREEAAGKQGFDCRLRQVARNWPRRNRPVQTSRKSTGSVPSGSGHKVRWVCHVRPCVSGRADVLQYSHLNLRCDFPFACQHACRL